MGNRGGKHQSWAKNPNNGLWYELGGDWPGTSPYETSYRQEMHTWDLVARAAGNESAGWATEQPYCRTDGGMQPKHPDYMGWVWDSRRQVFVMLPGLYEVGSGLCANETVTAQSDGNQFIFREGVMAYDPVAKKHVEFRETKIK